ncbi:MAG: DpnI domain-containing protein, partial [Thermoplasmata archaeon]
MDTRFNPVLASGYSSRSQIARVLTEDWVERELYCLSCRSEELEPTRKNTKSRDFRCRDCSEPYELKSAARSFGGMVLDGAFETMRSTVLQGRSPNLLLLEYDRPSLSVTNLHAVHRGFLTPSEIVPRRAPLPQTARRAGWLG